MESIQPIAAVEPGLRAELRDLYDDYAAALDELDFTRWIECFTDDCSYRVVSRENFELKLPLSTMACDGAGSLRDRVAAIRQTAVFEPRTLRHIVSTVRINSIDGDIRSQGNFITLECLSDREPHLFMVGRYLDRVVRQDGRLKLRERVCVFDNHRIRTSLVFPV
jgi:anthranilate 1,2-dioxygenase small subunit